MAARIVTDPKIMLGKPTVRGTRITVEQILRLLAQKLTVKEISEDFPKLAEADIKAAVEYAAKKLAKPQVQATKRLHEVLNR